MKKVIRLTESDLTRIVKRVISESKDKDHNKIKKLICSAMDRFVGEDDYTCGYKESSDKPYDRFMVKIKNVIDEDTKELAKDVVKYVNRELEKTTLRVGNTSKEMFWLTYIDERDYDYIMEILANEGLHPNSEWFNEFERSRFYDEVMTDYEYAEELYDFINHGDNEY